jgi:hypothetical protein
VSVTDKQIREWYGHNGRECRVCIRRDGTVERYGSPDPTDRSADYWAYLGTREQIVAMIEIYREHGGAR